MLQFPRSRTTQVRRWLRENIVPIVTISGVAGLNALSEYAFRTQPDEVASPKYKGPEGSKNYPVVNVQPGSFIDFPFGEPELADLFRESAAIRVIYAIPSDGLDRQFYRESIPISMAAIQRWMSEQTQGRRWGLLPGVTLVKLNSTIEQIEMSKSALTDLTKEIGGILASRVDKNSLLSASRTGRVVNLVLYDAPTRFGDQCGVAPGPRFAFVWLQEPNCGTNITDSPKQFKSVEQIETHELLHSAGAVAPCHGGNEGGHLPGTGDIMSEDGGWGSPKLDPAPPNYFNIARPGCLDVAKSDLLRGPLAIENAIWDHWSKRDRKDFGAPITDVYQDQRIPGLWRMDFQRATIFWTKEVGACTRSELIQQCTGLAVLATLSSGGNQSRAVSGTSGSVRTDGMELVP